MFKGHFNTERKSNKVKEIKRSRNYGNFICADSCDSKKGHIGNAKLNVVNPGQTVDFGAMKVEFIRTTHSIPDACSLAIHTPVGVVVHTGDFKIDYTPIDGEMMDFGRLAELGNRGVLALMSDSTNSERKGYTMSESTVGEVLDKLFINCTKRIVVATFSSNVHRVQH